MRAFFGFGGAKAEGGTCNVRGEDVLPRRLFERSFDALLYSLWVYLSILSCVWVS